MRASQWQLTPMFEDNTMMVDPHSVNSGIESSVMVRRAVACPSFRTSSARACCSWLVISLRSRVSCSPLDTPWGSDLAMSFAGWYYVV